MGGRKTIILLILIILTITAVSCAEAENTQDGGGQQENNNQENSGDTISGQADETDMFFTPELPDMHFEGYTFNILNTENDSVTWLLTQLESEEETGEAFNDAVYRRNRIAEEKYGINISETLVVDYGQVNSNARRIIRAGGEDYDLYMLQAGDALSMAQDGSIVDYRDIPNVDLSKGYWDRDMVRDLSLGERLFVFSGDFNFTPYSATIVMFFNKKLHSDLQLPDVYQSVRDGKWTFDAFHNMAKTASADLDGNGVFNQYDQYGYMSLNFLLYPSFIISGGENFLKKNADDMPVLSVDGERFTSVYHKILSIMHDGNLLYDADLAGRDHRHQDVMFPGNQALFWSELMNWAKILRDMEADFGILPHPKFNDTQEGYHSVVFGPSFMLVPSTSGDLARTGVILEALCAESRKTVMPAYYDIQLQTITTRDEESGEMLNIIFSNRTYELGQLFFSGQVFDPFNTMARANNGDVGSYIDRNADRIETAIERVVERLAEVD